MLIDDNSSPTLNRAKKYAGIYLAVILFIISFGLGILVSRIWFVNEQVTDENGDVEITKVINLNRSLNKSNSVEFSQFWEVWDKIKEKYVEQPVNEVDLFYGALQGMVAALGDPHSNYFRPQAALEFSKSLSGELEGIGAEISIRNDQLVVVAPLPGTPAEKAGLLPGDQILAVNGTSTFGMDINTAVSRIRGKRGTEVTLLINRASFEDGPQEIKIVRSKINVPAVMYSMRPGQIAYLRIMQFNGTTKADMNRHINTLKALGAKGIVLDLRNNPGGFLNASVDMASEWVEDGIIVSEKGNDGEGNDLNSKGKARLAGIKTVVLVNRGSASASEIVAGALQDHKLGVVMGEQTFGKGSVQDFEPLADGSALKLTVAEWFTPSGRNINREGIEPDILLEEIDITTKEVGDDPWLNQALDLFASSTFKWPEK